MRKKILSLFVSFSLALSLFSAVSVSAADYSYYTNTVSYGSIPPVSDSLIVSDSVNNLFITASSYASSGSSPLLFVSTFNDLSNGGGYYYFIKNGSISISATSNNSYSVSCSGDISVVFYNSERHSFSVSSPTPFPKTISISNRTLFSRSFYESVLVPTFTPFDSVYYAYPVGIDKPSFNQWIIDNDKLDDLPSWIGTAYLSAVTSLFDYSGNSSELFKNQLVNFVTQHSIIGFNQSFSESLRLKYFELYNEYLNYNRVSVISSQSEHLHHRNDIITNTTDDNTTLITDLDSDTLDISILRDILRATIYIPSSVTFNVDRVLNKLDNMQFSSQFNEKLLNLSELYTYSDSDFSSQFSTFQGSVNSEVLAHSSSFNSLSDGSYIPENFLSQSDTLTITNPIPDAVTLSDDMSEFNISSSSSYTFNLSDYPAFDSFFKTLRRFTACVMVFWYANKKRFQLSNIIRGET